jgi:hypothetical protein
MPSRARSNQRRRNGSRVSIWYDQSGNGNDVTQSTIGNAPRIYVSGATQLFKSGGKPALEFLFSLTFLENTGLSANPTNTYYGSALMRSDGNFPTPIIGGTTNSNFYWRVNNGSLAQEVLKSAAASLGTASIGQDGTSGSVLEMTYLQGTGGSMWVDGASAGSLSSNTFAGGSTFRVGVDSSENSGNARMGELILYDAVGKTRDTAIQVDQKAYWGTP